MALVALDSQQRGEVTAACHLYSLHWHIFDPHAYVFRSRRDDDDVDDDDDDDDEITLTPLPRCSPLSLLLVQERFVSAPHL